MLSGKGADIMKRAMQTATLVLLVASFVLHWQLAAETAILRRDTATLHSRVICQQRDTEVLRRQVTVPPAGPEEKRATPTAVSKPTPAEQARARDLLEREVEEVRGLKFVKSLAYRSMKSAEFKNFLLKKIREEYTPQEIRDYSRSLAMVGLVPEGVDFEACVMQVMDEQVAAFYDQDKGDLYTFDDSPLTGNLNRMILAHEMTHALQDQHFHIKQWPLKRKDNDDLVSAHLAVLEGDATVRMHTIYKRGLKWKTVLSDFGAALSQDTSKLAAAPRYFRDMLLFPYQEGAAFIEELEYIGGPALVNRAFEAPPSSTAQILHPEKFYPKRQDPEPADPEAKPQPDWRKLASNAVGEFGIIVLLRQSGHEMDAAAIAGGWRGDRYATFEAGNGDGWLYWRSVWGSDAAAKRFADIYGDVVTKRNTRRQPAVTIGLHQTGRRVDVVLRSPPTINHNEAVSVQKQ